MAFPAAGQTVERHTYPQIVCTRFAPGDPGLPAQICQPLPSQPQMRVRDARHRVWQASSSGLMEIDSSGEQRNWVGKDGLPIRSVTGVTHAPDGGLWLATRQGAVCFRPDAPPGEQWFYF